MKNNQGFGQILIVILIAIVAMYFIKDDAGVRYTDKVINSIKYYTVDRNKDALNKAEGAKSILEKRSADLQKMIDEN